MRIRRIPLTSGVHASSAIAEKVGRPGLEPGTSGLGELEVEAPFQGFLEMAPLFLSRVSTSVQGFHGVA